MKSLGIGATDEYLLGIVPGGGGKRLAEMLLGLQASNVPADIATDAAVAAIAEAQEADGSWTGGDIQNRPPISQSSFAATANCIRALQAYEIPGRKEEFGQRIALARKWLLHAKPVTTEDAALRLAGLVYAAAPARDIQNAAKVLLALQRSDGGWGGNPHMPSDAFATGNALLALADSKMIKVTDRPTGVAWSICSPLSSPMAHGTCADAPSSFSPTLRAASPSATINGFPPRPPQGQRKH
jgi:hypothetical protein